MWLCMFLPTLWCMQTVYACGVSGELLPVQRLLPVGCALLVSECQLLAADSRFLTPQFPVLQTTVPVMARSLLSLSEVLASRGHFNTSPQSLEVASTCCTAFHSAQTECF